LPQKDESTYESYSPIGKCELSVSNGSEFSLNKCIADQHPEPEIDDEPMNMIGDDLLKMIDSCSSQCHEEEYHFTVTSPV